jgi:pimeloyl-ACP methyl ester carboxylesterase
MARVRREVFGEHVPEFVIFVCSKAHVDDGLPQPRRGKLLAREDPYRVDASIVSFIGTRGSSGLDRVLEFAVANGQSGAMSDLRVLELADGRDLACREFGTRDGAPVFALHGSPGSHSNFAPVGSVAAREGVRLIAPDRPGYGHSTFDPVRTYKRAAADIEELADHLELEEFGVLGWSSGGPNAASCARYLGSRVLGCAIVSGPAPPEGNVSAAGTMRANRVAKRLEVLAPWVMSPLFQAGLRQGRRSPEKSLAWMLRHLPDCDARVIERPEVRKHLLADIARPVSSTAGRTAVQDICLEARPWGFDLRAIECPVHVWHGDADDTVTPANGKYQANVIRQATLHEIPGEGHWLLYEHFSDILGKLRVKGRA